MTVLKSYQVSTYAYLGGWAATADNRIATAIAMAESSGKTDARNPSGARGLWQIMPATARDVGADYSKLDDPAYNAHAAHAVYKKQGWHAWSTYNSGAYKAHLGDASNPPTPDVPGLPGSGGALDATGAGLRDIGRAGQWLADPRSWLRVVQVAAGGALLIGAALVVARPVVEPAVKAAAKVAPVVA